MSRKGENIYKRKDNRWEGRYQLEGLQGEKNKYHSVYGKSYKEVKEKLLIKKREQMVTGKKNGYLPNKMLMKEAMEQWLEEGKKKWKESTFSTYRTITEKYFLPFFGNIRIVMLDIDIYTSFFERSRNPENGKKLSEGYLHQIYIILGQIIKYMEKKYYCTLVKLPSLTLKTKIKPLRIPKEENIRKLETFLLRKAKEGDKTCLGILLSGYSGIRIGELCALRWEDIQFDKGALAISKTMQRIRIFQNNQEKDISESGKGTKIVITSPKSLNANRVIPLSENLLEILNMHRGEKNSYIIQGIKKEYAEPRTLQYRLQKILKKLNIPLFNFHMLRHIFATNCISQGFDMKTVSELLGHSNINITMRIYVHSDMERKKQLMASYRMAA